MSAAERLESFDNYPVIDKDKIQAIIDLAEDDDEFFRELTDMFFERAPLLMSEIKAAYQTMDATKFERSSHALKGTSGNLGAIQLMKVCEVLEQLGRDKDLNHAEDLVQRLDDIYASTKSDITENYL